MGVFVFLVLLKFPILLELDELVDVELELQLLEAEDETVFIVLAVTSSSECSIGSASVLFGAILPIREDEEVDDRHRSPSSSIIILIFGERSNNKLIN